MNTFLHHSLFKNIFSAFLLNLFFIVPAFSQYNVDALLKQAITDVGNENYTEAISKLNTCLTAEPTNSVALFYRAACKYSLFDNTGAELDFTLALAKYSPVYYDAYRYRAQTRYRLSDYAGAIEDLNKVIEKINNDPKLYLERAFARLAANDYTGALSDCQKSLKLKPMGDDVYLCKAAAEEALENYSQAILDYDEALKFNSTNKVVLVRRGNMRFKTEDYSGAIDDYNLALKADSAYTPAYFYRGETEAKLNNNKAALRDYAIVIAYDPRNSYAYFNRAVLYANMEEYKNALEDLNKVMLLNPSNIQALSNRAKIKQQTKDLKGAIKDYDKIIELYPYYMEAYYYRAQVKSSLNDVAGAKKDYETGKMMSEVFHSKSSEQLQRDSILLAELYRLDADFVRPPKTMMDTVNVRFQAFFYLDVKKNNSNTQCSYSPLLNKINNQEKKSICFTNTELHPDKSKPLQQQDKSHSWADVIQNTNGYLINAAAGMINKIIEKDSLNAVAWFQRGVITCREAELSNSIEEPSFSESSSHTANENKIKMEHLSAMDDFTRAIQLQPSFSFAYFNRANIKCASGDFDGALKDYETTIKKNPDFAEAYFNMGYILYYMNEKNAACEKFSKAGELGIAGAYVFIKQYCTTIVK